MIVVVLEDDEKAEVGGSNPRSKQTRTNSKSYETRDKSLSLWKTRFPFAKLFEGTR